MTTTFTPTDIVNFAAKKDAVNISAAFDELVGQKVLDAIEDRKKHIASTMFKEPEAEEETMEISVEDSEEENIDATTGSSEPNTEQETEESNEEAEVNN